MRATSIAALAALGFLSAACGRAHLAPGFGKATREALAAQQSERQGPAPTMRLDTQEAEVIAQGYVRSLAGKGKAEPEPVLYVQPQRQGGGAAALPPSVPRN